MQARIFNIQRFSIHDGPGIRTTIFFKGCDLHCAWCANPESQLGKPQPLTDADRCTRCGRCVRACAQHARVLLQDTAARTQPRLCIACGACVQACPAEAIALSGRTMSMDEVLEEALADRPFYEGSGGGVTFSGGEVLLQRSFASELAKRLHENGVHVAIETAGNISPEAFREFLKDIDFVQIDLKHWDARRHLEGTGVSNEWILSNIAYTAACGIGHIVRIPVIPGYNDSPEDADGFADILRTLGVAEVQLLPFHQMGERKYEQLARPYAYIGKLQLHPEDLEAYRARMSKGGLTVRF